MIDIKELRAFVIGLLSDKNRDTLHGIEHSDRILKGTNKISSNYSGKYCNELLMFGAYFHGAIHYGEKPIRDWLRFKGYEPEYIDKIIKVTWESQSKNEPTTLEGKLLQDSHNIEGGKEYFVLKPLLVGTVMKQPIEKTIRFITDVVLTNEKYYLPETKEYIDEIYDYANEFIHNLKEGLL